MDEKENKLLRQIEKEYSLNGPETGILRILVQSEINITGRMSFGTHKALKNFEKRSPVLRAYKEFHRRRLN